MKFTFSWLCEHLETQLTPVQIGSILTMAGLELESLIDLSIPFKGVEAGLLTQIIPHPNADRLTLCQVLLKEETLSIVCGARNHRVGSIVAVARAGAVLANGLEIREGQIRGELSQGMLCSETELGLSSEQEISEGILILPADTPPGTPLADLLGQNDFLFELNITPNRGDCLGVRGIARELSALGAGQLKSLVTPTICVTNASHNPTILLNVPERSPRYTGRIITGVRVTESPDWLQRRLKSVGLRPINAIVDVTNFICMDLNHPMHAFDLAKIHWPLVIRPAQDGETLVTLDKVERTLSPENTLIADANAPLALAGLMGGLNSGVTLETTDLFLEVAYFDPIYTARSGRKLDIQSDSRHRFERGIDPLGLKQALERATEMILALAGGQAGPITERVGGTWQPQPPIPFRTQRANRIGGVQLSQEQTHTMLTALGCQEIAQTEKSEMNTRFYQPPSHRHDLKREEDLIEEVVRLFGYDRVETQLPRGAIATPMVDPNRQLTNRIRHLLTGLGYLEAIDYAFISADLQHRFDSNQPPIFLQNPLSEDQAVLRTQLFPGLLATLERNLNRGNQRLRLFEVGRVFLQEPGQRSPREEERLAVILTGPSTERAWHTPMRESDLFDLKGDLEALLRGLGWLNPIFSPGGPSFLHPGQKTLVSLLESKTIGWLGQLHPTEQEHFNASQPIFVCEFSLSSLTQPPEVVSERPFSKYPSVERDFSFVVEESVLARDLLHAIAQVDTSLIRKVLFFDLYVGEGIQSGYKSLAIGVTLQADDHTLTEQETNTIAERIVKHVHDRFHATLR
ncbi:MAG: phenylalanine--tRNA ligase subunit beta [Magnetococcus sp. DMHC-6]